MYDKKAAEGLYSLHTKWVETSSRAAEHALSAQTARDTAANMGSDLERVMYELHYRQHDAVAAVFGALAVMAQVGLEGHGVKIEGAKFSDTGQLGRRLAQRFREFADALEQDVGPEFPRGIGDA